MQSEPIYVMYGGWTGQASHDQVSAALQYATDQVRRTIGTFMEPTLTSGTYTLEWPPKPFYLQHSRIIGIVEVEPNDAGLMLRVLNSETGLVEVITSGTYCIAVPPSITITYWAGFPTGTVTADPGILAAWAVLAKTFLYQLVDDTRLEGGAGNPGVQSFSSGKYSETRAKLRATPFGDSPIVRWAYERLEKWRKVRADRL